ncbi:facilitated trehalose transporter Tret1 isoform X3 [Amyelois transitella]|uniref:facilitated trehalose transporter Tret1 isoform X3 n=1 Tax=Amyelois transitella TaxID=680683 RepID=UPI00067C6CCB|nr:facilitated trehalose transporter Tret1 isoform X3 [Amyelois transitella]
MERGGRKVQYLIVAAVSLATVTMGVSSAWPTPVLVKFHNNETDIRVNESQMSWMLALSAPGFIVGSLMTGFICERFGRRSCVLFSALPISTGTVIVAFSVNVWLLYITRFLWGFGTGMISTVANMYIAEIADKEIRGELSIATKFMFNFGNLLVMVIGHYVSYTTLNYMMLVLPLGYFFACCWIPETPYFYLKEGKVTEAKKVLMMLRNYEDKENLENDFRSLQADVKNEMRRSGSIAELVSGKQYRKAILISIGLKLALILTGGITTRNYLGRIMQEGNWLLGLDFVLIVFGAISFIVGIMSSLLSDRVGRRPLLIYSFLGTGISLGLVAAYFFCQEVLLIERQTLRQYSWIPFVGIILSTIISTLGYNSLAFLIPAEMFPLNVKSTALTWLNVFGGILGFGVAKGYQEIKNVSGLFGVFTLFGGVAIAGTIFSYFFVPETKGKSLKEIQQLLQGDLYENNSNEKLNHIVVKGIDDDGNEATELKEMIQKN